MLSAQQWEDFDKFGLLHLGKLLDGHELQALTKRADDLASGAHVNPHIKLQLDTGGDYDALPDAISQLEVGTVLYRKVQGLENDELFSPLVRHPLFREICANVYGPHAPVSLFRAMIMNKPAGQGTLLPWHQDGGDVWALDRDPLVTIWVALDSATLANGCVEVIPSSHRLGLLSSHGSTLSAQDVGLHCPTEQAIPLEVEAGHGVLLHNWLIHRSGINPSNRPRRAFTACYMDGRTRSVLTGDHFPRMFGQRDDAPHHYVRQLHVDSTALRHSQGVAEEYAKSLEAEVARLRRKTDEIETYAKSLEQLRVRQLAAETQGRTAPVRRGLLHRVASALAGRARRASRYREEP